MLDENKTCAWVVVVVDVVVWWLGIVVALLYQYYYYYYYLYNQSTALRASQAYPVAFARAVADFTVAGRSPGPAR